MSTGARGIHLMNLKNVWASLLPWKQTLMNWEKRWTMNKEQNLYLSCPLHKMKWCVWFTCFLKSVLWMSLAATINRINLSFWWLLRMPVKKLMLAISVCYHLRKKWVFNEVYKIILITLYVEESIKCNHLILTDKDSAKYEPVVNAVKTTKTYNNTTHMLCVFHALAKNSKM